jgi:predicted nucleic acid-binding protein
MGTKTGEVLKGYFETLRPEEKVSCSLITISEVFYILCRLRGAKFAEEKINDMLASRVLDICDSIEIAVRTGKIKCERNISLADCSCLAVAEMTKAKAVFAKREKELVKEIEKKPFNVEIIFLQDLES